MSYEIKYSKKEKKNKKLFKKLSGVVNNFNKNNYTLPPNSLIDLRDLYYYI